MNIIARPNSNLLDLLTSYVKYRSYYLIVPVLYKLCDFGGPTKVEKTIGTQIFKHCYIFCNLETSNRMTSLSLGEMAEL